MKKIFAITSIAILFIVLSGNNPALASTYTLNPDNYQNVFYITGYNSGWYSGTVLVTIVVGSNYVLSFNNGSTQNDLRSQYNLFNLINVNIGDFSVESNVGTQSTAFNMRNIQSIVVYKGSFDFGNYTTPEQSFDNWQDYQDFINPPEPDPSWWEKLWNTFEDYFTNPIPGGWIKNLINNVFGDDENEDTISDSVDFTNPTLTPAPTPIPYQTVVIPKTDPVTGDTYYETNYIYNGPSGTPIVQPYPPTNPQSTNAPSGNNGYNPVNGDPYSIPLVNWLTSATIGDTNYDGLDSIGDGMTSVDEIGSEYIDGIGAAQDATSVLPDSWLLLIGVAAAIPLLAGIISRFLS